jgi:glycine hydroxymethyltransferase
MHIIAAKAVAFKEALSPEFKEYQKQIVSNASAMACALINKGIDLVTGGTDNHLMLADLTNTGMTGKDAQNKLDEVNITCNKNGIPFDTRSPFVTSGIRLGTPAVTTRGMKEQDMVRIAEAVAMVVKQEPEAMEKAKGIVRDLVEKYPLYEA